MFDMNDLKIEYCLKQEILEFKLSVFIYIQKYLSKNKDKIPLAYENCVFLLKSISYFENY